MEKKIKLKNAPLIVFLSVGITGLILPSISELCNVSKGFIWLPLFLVIISYFYLFVTLIDKGLLKDENTIILFSLSTTVLIALVVIVLLGIVHGYNLFESVKNVLALLVLFFLTNFLLRLFAIVLQLPRIQK